MNFIEINGTALRYELSGAGGPADASGITGEAL